MIIPATVMMLGFGVAVGVPFAYARSQTPHHVEVAQFAPLNAGEASALAAAPVNPGLHHQATAVEVKAARPVHISVPTLNIDAQVVAAGVNSEHEFAVPSDIQLVGWYQYGAEPGSGTGSIVLSGHVDDHIQGLGAMWTLRNATLGALVSLQTANGETHTYKVVSREQFAKSTAPMAQIFATTGPERLTLVTCGGVFDRAALSYEDNIVVTALPVSG